MFEQTFLNKPENARKPYSMVLSLILQILVIGVLCLIPLVFTSVMPNMQMRSVIAAPPKPPVALKSVPTASHASAAAPSLFHLTEIVPLSRISAARASVAEMAAPSVEGATNSGDSSGVPDSVLGLAPPPVPPPAMPAKPVAQTPKVIVGSILTSNLIHKVQPEYPPLAKAARVQGVVEFTATISREGTIENLTLVRGHPLLVKAAKEAVLQWRYKPTLLNGEPVEVITDILVNFTLNQ